MFVGVDGCKTGWFAVAIDGDGHWSAHVYQSAQALLDAHRDASLILIDIPIGLRESGAKERLCDLEARKRLSPKRGSSVFPAPCRRALSAGSYAEACRINRQNTGRGLSLQSWAIAGKIREVDELLGGKPFDGRVREVHPEVCFAAFAGGCPMKHSKKRTPGFAERMRVLRKFYPRTDEVVDYALDNWRRKQVARDDIVDALAAAVTAYLGHSRLKTLPDGPELDARGRPMEIVFFGELLAPKPRR